MLSRAEYGKASTSQDLAVAPVHAVSLRNLSELLGELAQVDKAALDDAQKTAAAELLFDVSQDFAFTRVALFKGKAIGLISGFSVPDPYAVTPCFFINTLVVKKAHQNQGVATQLLACLEQESQETLVVAVSFFNALATSFYLSRGFDRSTLSYWCLETPVADKTLRMELRPGFDLLSGRRESWTRAEQISDGLPVGSDPTTSGHVLCGLSRLPPKASRKIDCQILRKDVQHGG